MKICPVRFEFPNDSVLILFLKIENMAGQITQVKSMFDIFQTEFGLETIVNWITQSIWVLEEAP